MVEIEGDILCDSLLPISKFSRHQYGILLDYHI